MRRATRLVTVLAAAAGLTLAPLVAVGAESPPGAGAAGVGDPYFPLDGNGGFDVQNYDLALDYNPDTDRLVGTATLRARATQSLSSFHLDLVGLTVGSITVDGAPARFRRNGQELIITPARSLASGAAFTVVVKYSGIPLPVPDVLGAVGFTAYAEGAYVAGQPHGAAGWFPVNDHPIDKAAYTFRVSAPSGLDVVANGVLTDKRTQGGKTTWTWTAKEPMASYLTTLAIGAYGVRSYRTGGIQYVDAVADALSAPFAAPRTGTAFALSNPGLSGYSRLSRVISVPAGGADLSFQLARQVEPEYDYVFVEAHTVGADDWTTLPDRNGHTSQDVGQACLYGWSFIHPFIERYQTIVDGETCLPSGTTGQWWGATGSSAGYEEWSVDLAPYAGRDVEVSITYVTDDLVLGSGAFVDDVVVSTGAGTTSFESDGDVFDGWQVLGAPAGSPGNTSDWVAGTADDVPTLADQANASLARQPEIIRFLASRFGPYPFSAAGGIVVADDALGFALETQTRPIYSPAFFGSPESGDSVIVHELAHQWFGDSLALKRWKDIWLNEGFATYAEWLWSEREGGASAQEIFDFYASFPTDDGFWQLTIGDPGSERLFDGAVYNRGAMTLHALRLELGDGPFFALLKRWVDRNAGGNVATPQFIALAEQVGGQQLDAFFDVWLYTAAKPAGIEPAAAARAAAGRTVPQFTADISRRLAEN